MESMQRFHKRIEAHIQAANNDQGLARRGQWMAFILSIAFLIAGV